jgi:hypothetical protein
MERRSLERGVRLELDEQPARTISPAGFSGTTSKVLESQSLTDAISVAARTEWPEEDPELETLLARNWAIRHELDEEVSSSGRRWDEPSAPLNGQAAGVR